MDRLGDRPQKRSMSVTRQCAWLFAAYLLLGAIHYGLEWALVYPSAEMHTLEGYRRRHPNSPVVTFRHRGQRYFVAFGTCVLFNEAPAGYLFDSDGALIGWSSEAHDVDALADYWMKAQFHGEPLLR